MIDCPQIVTVAFLGHAQTELSLLDYSYFCIPFCSYRLFGINSHQ
jgi:hypothetical protein